MKNIILTGFMGTGKSSVGRRLARELNREFIDTDDLIEKEVGLKIPLIFDRYGEASFRAVEKKIIKDAVLKDNRVIATGGGAIIDEENLAALKASGLIVCLTSSVDAILSRIGTGKERPLLNQPDRKDAVEKILEYRKPFYAKADLSVDTTNKTVNEVVAEIKTKIIQILWAQ